MVTRVLESMGETVRAWGDMYNEVVQSVLVYIREIWMVTGEILKLLTGFHHRAAKRITGMTAKRGADG